MRNSDFKNWDRTYLWHPFTQMRDYETEEPLIIERGEGNYLFDIDGKKYLDGISSLWVTVHGHNHPKLTAAISEQAGKISHSTLLGLSNVPAVCLAKELLEVAPSNLKKVFYSDSGSTAVEIALKMAFQYWKQNGRDDAGKKNKFLRFKNAYHGDTLGAVSVGGIDLFHEIYQPLLFQSIEADFESAFDLIMTHHQELAAVIIEPKIQGAAGMLLQPDGFLKKLEAACRKWNVLLIADEVATGFGRTGKMFACEHEGIKPDLMAIAKGITGGYLPLAATLASQEIYDAFKANYEDLKTFFHGHTYTGNPLACAAALANLEIFREEKTLEKLQSKIEYLAKGLEKIAKHPSVYEIRQLGMMVGIDLRANSNGDPFPLKDKVGNRIILEARKQGLILRPLGNVLVLMPPLSILKPEIDFLLEVTFASIQKILI